MKEWFKEKRLHAKIIWETLKTEHTVWLNCQSYRVRLFPLKIHPQYFMPIWGIDYSDSPRSRKKKPAQDWIRETLMNQPCSISDPSVWSGGDFDGDELFRNTEDLV